MLGHAVYCDCHDGTRKGGTMDFDQHVAAAGYRRVASESAYWIVPPSGPAIDEMQLIQHLATEGWSIEIDVRGRGHARREEWHVVDPDGQRSCFSALWKQLRDEGWEYVPAQKARYERDLIVFTEAELRLQLRAQGWRPVGYDTDQQLNDLRPPKVAWYTAEQCDAWLERHAIRIEQQEQYDTVGVGS